MKNNLVPAIVLRLLLQLHGNWDTFAILEILHLSFDLDLGAFFRETKNLNDAQMFSFVKMTKWQVHNTLEFWKEKKSKIVEKSQNTEFRDLKTSVKTLCSQCFENKFRKKFSCRKQN